MTEFGAVAAWSLGVKAALPCDVYQSRIPGQAMARMELAMRR
jgi:hypothetical protein